MHRFSPAYNITLDHFLSGVRDRTTFMAARYNFLTRSGDQSIEKRSSKCVDTHRDRFESIPLESPLDVTVNRRRRNQFFETTLLDRYSTIFYNAVPLPCEQLFITSEK